jgi:hypothetical protein
MDNSLTTSKDSWFSEHKSALFILCLFFIGFILVTLGILLHDDNQIINFLGKLLIELSIASFAGCIATIFLSLRDVRHNLASTVATLVSEGHVVGLLSRNAQQNLNREIVQNNIKDRALFIENSLFNNITKISNQCLQMVHLYNYHWQQTISQHPTNQNLLVNDVVRTFRIRTSHLRHPVNFDFKLLHEISIQSFPNITDEEFAPSFDAQFGNERFTKEYLSLKKDKIGSLLVFRCVFEQVIEIEEDEIDVKINYRIAYTKSENTTAVILRYPTLGFHFSMNYSDAFDYDCVWFKSQKPKDEDFPGREEIFPYVRGISVATHDWVLPGEGIYINWIPKQISEEYSTGGDGCL